MVRSALFSWIVILSSTLFCSAFQQTATIDLDRMGNLPVRFNGRLMTLDAVATNCATRVCDATTFQNPDGKKYSALEWYVYSICRSAAFEDIRCIPMSREMTSSIGITSDQTRFSLNELKPHFDAFQAKADSLKSMDFKNLGTVDREINKVVDRLRMWLELISSHDSPWEIETALLPRMIEQMTELEQRNVPHMVIPEEKGITRWSILLSGSVLEYARLAVDKTPTGYAKELSELLKSVKDNSAESYDEHLGNINRLLHSRQLDEHALKFTPPPGFIDLGVTHTYRRRFYSDGQEMGLMASMFGSGTDDDGATITINHFPEKQIDPMMLCNSWRIDQGLAPLSKEEFELQVAPEQIAGRKTWSIDIETPEDLPNRAMRVIASVIEHPTGTWTASLYGVPTEVKTNRRRFKRFLNNLVIPDSVHEWMAARPINESDVIERHPFCAVVKRGTKFDCIFLISGPQTSIVKARKDIVEVVANLELKDHVNKTNTTFQEMTGWIAPEKWILSDEASDQQPFYLVPIQVSNEVVDDSTNDFVAVKLMIVEKTSEQQIINWANHLRAWMKLEPMTMAEANSEIRIDRKNKLVEILNESQK